MLGVNKNTERTQRRHRRSRNGANKTWRNARVCASVSTIMGAVLCLCAIATMKPCAQVASATRGLWTGLDYCALCGQCARSRILSVRAWQRESIVVVVVVDVFVVVVVADVVCVCVCVFVCALAHGQLTAELLLLLLTLLPLYERTYRFYSIAADILTNILFYARRTGALFPVSGRNKRRDQNAAIMS